MQSMIVNLMHAPVYGWYAITGRKSRLSGIVGTKF